MAELIGLVRNLNTYKLMETKLAIRPIMPSINGLRDAYMVQLGPSQDDTIVEISLVLEGFQWAHDDIMQVARMFEEAESLFNVENKFHGRIALTYTVNWADVWIVRSGKRSGSDRRVDVFFYLYDRDPRSNPENGWRGDRCTTFVIGATLEDAVQFGNDLLKELIDAWKYRQALGISVEDEAEDWPEYFANDPKWSRYFTQD